MHGTCNRRLVYKTDRTNPHPPTLKAPSQKKINKIMLSSSPLQVFQLFIQTPTEFGPPVSESSTRISKLHVPLLLNTNFVKLETKIGHPRVWKQGLLDRQSVVATTFFFYLDFISRTRTIHRTAGEGGGYFFNSSVPLPPASQTLRHWPGNYCRQLISAHSKLPDSNRERLISKDKSLTTKRRTLKP